MVKTIIASEKRNKQIYLNIFFSINPIFRRKNNNIKIMNEMKNKIHINLLSYQSSTFAF